MTLIQQLLAHQTTPTTTSTSSHPLPYFIANKSSSRLPTIPIHWRNASEQSSRQQEISLNTRFEQPSNLAWSSKQPYHNLICSVFLAINPRLIPQDEYNLGSLLPTLKSSTPALIPLMDGKTSTKTFPTTLPTVYSPLLHNYAKFYNPITEEPLQNSLDGIPSS